MNVLLLILVISNAYNQFYDINFRSGVATGRRIPRLVVESSCSSLISECASNYGDGGTYSGLVDRTVDYP